MKLSDPFFDGFPGAEDRYRGEQGGEHHEEEADAVDSHVIVDVEARHPFVLLGELEAGGLSVKASQESEAEGEGRQGAEERGHPELGGLVSRDEEQQDGCGDRYQQGEGDAHALTYPPAAQSVTASTRMAPARNQAA